MDVTGADSEKRHGLTLDQLEQHLTEIKDYQITHGSMLKHVADEEETTVRARTVAVSVVPSDFSREHFQQALGLQSAMDMLYICAASDEQWLAGVIQPLLELDEFARALWSIHLESQKARSCRASVHEDEDSATCGIFRSDYMLHLPAGQSQPCLKQVEMNTFSCSGACHAERIRHMHAHLQRILEANPTPAAALPRNEATNSIAQLLEQAYITYKPLSQLRSCVLMVVQPLNFNIADERPIEYALWDRGIPCYRCDWLDILDHTRVGSDGALLFSPAYTAAIKCEVAIVYYRAGYEAVEYHERGQQTRLRLELSRAIKCPDVLTHLTTFKAVQQALARSGAVERFLKEEDAVRVRSTFMEIRTLEDSAEGVAARKLATTDESARAYVLKPNLEGGGHNVYGEDIPGFLLNIAPGEWQKYILMRKIEPPDTQGLLMSAQGLYDAAVVSELGVLGGVLWRRSSADGKVRELMQNKTLGWTFKTKPKDIDEMSVVKGFGCFDCPRLVDDVQPIQRNMSSDT